MQFKVVLRVNFITLNLNHCIRKEKWSHIHLNKLERELNKPKESRTDNKEQKPVKLRTGKRRKINETNAASLKTSIKFISL